MLIFLFSIFCFLGLILWGIKMVPQQSIWIVQRLGKFSRKLEPGLNWTIPFVDEIAYRHSLKEEAIEVPVQTAITQDNVSVILDGIVYAKVFDPIAASYGVKDPIFALIQLVQTTMRSEIGKLPLDKTFEERGALSANIVEVINEASRAWGIFCMRYEIKDIQMPEDIRKAMELQMTAERQKRARILESEGIRQARINESEAAQIDRVNRARGDAEAILIVSQATGSGIRSIAEALEQAGGEQAASLQIAEKYIEAFRHLAKETNTIVLPANLQSPSSMVTEALTIYQALHRHMPEKLKN